jgi:hypothetical protein
MNNKLQLTSYQSRGTGHEARKNAASALIIAVILTSLLAIIGVMFVMIARVDKMATSAISENKELNSAVEAVVALVSQELVLDVPGMPKGGDYYDYPDANNTWLASLEPYEKTAGNYYWRQISDIYNKFGPVGSGLKAKIIPDYQPPSDVGDSDSISSYPADADGDGVADSNWVIIPDMNSNKGKPIFAAVRVIDNGAMINVNTAYKFDPNDPNVTAADIDGSSQLQINLEALARGADTIDGLADARNPLGRPLSAYLVGLIWRIEDPCRAYLPFDISDELTIHGRYIIKQKDTITRLKRVWEYAFDRSVGYNKTQPYTATGDLSRWFEKASSDANRQQYYNMPHISTTYNIDRIITPDCNKMTNINTADFNALYKSIRKGLLDANCIDANIAAQIAVNIVDYHDSDSNVTPYLNPDNGITYYGFERPCIYISELAWRIGIPPDANRSYAIELYKPYSVDNDPDSNWKIYITSPPSSISVSWSGSKQFHVIEWRNSTIPLSFDPTSSSQIPVDSPTFSTTIFDTGSTISLTRDVNGTDVVVDSVVVPGSSGLIADGNAHSIQRDITLHRCIRRLWDSNSRPTTTLGYMNDYNAPNSPLIQAHPANKSFTNIGEIGMLFRKSAYSQIGPADMEADVRLNLADPNFQQLFKYLTKFDPAVYSWNVPNETRIKGRININTAPWYVLAQLPWVSQRVGYNDANLARAIVAYRDKLDLSPDGPNYSGANGRVSGSGIPGLREAPGFESIGELAAVVNNTGKNNYSMDYYALGYGDLTGFPDLTPDTAPNDFEQRDVIFSRISNLVTVRSDVFTAYILVRIGKDGPQKRVMAVLDRSNVYSPTDKVRIIALHPVPDPR